MSLIMYPYNNASEGGRALADRLDIKMIKSRGSKFVGNQKKLVINWGNSESTEEVSKCRILNKPENVNLASNKLRFFERLYQNNTNNPDNNVRYVPYTTSRNTAAEWYADGHTIVARTVLQGHSGEGIVICDPAQGDPIPQARLYTKYVAKKSEYRIHVMNGRVLDVQRKARREDWPDDQVNWKVRNLAGGFVFVRNPESVGRVPANVKDNAVRAVRACGLDFGAVDILWNEKYQRAYVLEINTAPGLEGTTLVNYVSGFINNYPDDFAQDDEV